MSDEQFSKESFFNAFENEETRAELLQALEEKGYKAAPKEAQIIEPEKFDEFKKNIREEIASDITREIHSRYDEDLYSLTGERKRGDEKTYDFMKRAYSGTREQLEEAQRKAQELEEKIKSGASDETLKAQLQQWEEKYSEKEGEIQTLRESIQKEKIAGHLKGGLSGLKFADNLPEAVRDTYVNTVLNDLSAKAEVKEDGTVIFKGEDGPLLNRETLKPATAQELLKERLKDIIDTGNQQPGSGKRPEGKTDSNPAEVSYDQPPKSFDDVLTAVRAWGKKNGHTNISKEFKEQLDNQLKKYGIEA